jgi:hypothetical protein
MRSGLLLVCGLVASSLNGQAAAADPAAERPVEVAVTTAAPAVTEADRNSPTAIAKRSPRRSKGADAALAHSKSRLSEKPVPLLKEHVQLPERNPPIIEWNLPFLGPGNIISGFKSPTGAVWQPAFWVFGTAQSSAGVANDGIHPGREYASGRVDIYGHLQLTPTERVVIGFTPFSQGPNLGSGLLHIDGQGTQFVDAFNPNIQTLFFEGDTRQLFPGIDPDDRFGLDYGFAIGKQQIFYQEGIMINDNIQALGVTKDTIQIPGLTTNMRVTGLYGWADLRRGDAQPLPDHSAQLLGVFTETDLRKNIVTFDMAYVISDNPRELYTGLQRGGSGFFWGASSTQRFGDINTAFRINTSTALDAKGPFIDDGVLLLAEVSRTMPGTTNILYANFFAALGNYTSAARSAQVGGPLERVGILFVPLAAGLAGSPLAGDANHAIGGAIGYQIFFAPRKQLTIELAVKDYTNGDIRGVRESAAALGAQYVQPITSRTSVQGNAFVLDTDKGHFGYGLAVGTTTRW